VATVGTIQATALLASLAGNRARPRGSQTDPTPSTDMTAPEADDDGGAKTISAARESEVVAVPLGAACAWSPPATTTRRTGGRGVEAPV
jgi:hypothetical protein